MHTSKNYSRLNWKQKNICHSSLESVLHCHEIVYFTLHIWGEGWLQVVTYLTQRQWTKRNKRAKFAFSSPLCALVGVSSRPLVVYRGSVSLKKINNAGGKLSLEHLCIKHCYSIEVLKLVQFVDWRNYITSIHRTSGGKSTKKEYTLNFIYALFPGRKYTLCRYWAAVHELVYRAMKRHGHRIDME